MEMTEKTEDKVELAELSEAELEAVSGGYKYRPRLVIRNNIATITQVNVAVGSFNTQSNTAVVVQG